MEWLTGSQEAGNMEVDIGYMPQMELMSTTESVPAFQDGDDRRDSYIPTHQDESETNVIWKEEISVAEAERLLEVEMYPFKQVNKFETFMVLVLVFVLLLLFMFNSWSPFPESLMKICNLVFSFEMEISAGG